jgi:hypothetical protein
LNNQECYKVLTLNKDIYSNFDRTKGLLVQKIENEFEKKINELGEYLKEKENSVLQLNLH